MTFIRADVVYVQDNAELTRNITRQIPSRLRPRLEKVGERAVLYVEDFVEANFQHRAPGRRNPDVSPVPVHGSFYHEVEDRSGGGEIDMRVSIKSRADEKVVGIMEYGSPGHTIQPRRADFLLYPLGANRLPASPLENAQGSGHRKRADIVNAPPLPAHRMKRRALQRAVNEMTR